MADGSMADSIQTENFESRPFHRAYINRKLPCPHISCRGDAGKVFFEEKGLAQHFRAKHVGVFHEEKFTREAWRLFKFLHGQETKQHLERLTAGRLLQGSEYQLFIIATRYEGCRVLELAGKDARECAKLAGVMLMHFGQLRAYSDGARPELIEVIQPGLSVHFNAWFSQRIVSERSITTIVTEAILVKRDLTVSSLQDMTMPVITEVQDQEMTGNRPLDILRGIFHLKQFRGCQQEAIESIVSGQNTVLIMPTGGGKTVCYAVPALMEAKITVVIFPLLALLLDQVERMRSRGLNVCYLMSDMDETERESIIHRLHSKPPEYNFLFATPETVLSGCVFDLIQNLASDHLINFFVIDEAHCIDTWGFHFRPSYSELWRLREFRCPILAMTGTATRRTQEVIVSNLKLPSDTKVIRQTSNRPNLLYHVLDKKSDGKDALVVLIQKEYPEQCGIVYCAERSDTVDVTYRLKTAGVNAVFFHAGMDVCAKQQSVESWKSGGAHVMCATVAFGMGIDKPDVRFVMHHSVPKDLESYVQESGRAGRDGHDAHCYIFFRFEDRTKHLRNISSLPDNDRKLICLNGLNDIVKYCISPVCRRQQIVGYFDGEDTSGNICNRSCDICSGSKNLHPADHSEDAIKVVSCLESMQQVNPKVTTKFLVLTFRGSKANTVISKGFQNVRQYGMGKDKFSEKQLLKFVHFLITDNILAEQLRPANENSTTPYLVKGNNASKLVDKELCFYFYKQ